MNNIHQTPKQAAQPRAEILTARKEVRDARPKAWDIDTEVGDKRAEVGDEGSWDQRLELQMQ